jgi:hypothetical protein
MVSALDRFGMAQAFVDAGADVLFGDFIFALDLDKPVRGLAEFEALAERYLPDACKLPFQFFYPTGKKQDRPPQPKYPEYYAEAAIVAGDFHFMRQFMPARLDGKVVLTNTLTARDVDELRVRGVGRSRVDDAGFRRPLVRHERDRGGADRAARQTLERGNVRRLRRRCWNASRCGRESSIWPAATT